MKKLVLFFIFNFFIISCAVHPRSNIKADENFVLELKKHNSRGGMIETALDGILYGVNYLLKKETNSLNNIYSQSISINNYYNSNLGYIDKSYGKILLKKFSKPLNLLEQKRITSLLKDELSSLDKSNVKNNLFLKDDVKVFFKEDILNFYAEIELMSHPNNPGISRLCFKDLRVLFSKTKVYSDENLNVQVLVSIEGQWRNADGSPNKTTLVEHEYNFYDLKYGVENQIEKPVFSDWYYDIPIYPDLEDNTSYGVLKINIQMNEYEGNRSKYINKLPNILNENKDAIIKSGASFIKW